MFWSQTPSFDAKSKGRKKRFLLLTLLLNFELWGSKFESNFDNKKIPLAMPIAPSKSMGFVFALSHARSSNFHTWNLKKAEKNFLAMKKVSSAKLFKQGQ